MDQIRRNLHKCNQQRGLSLQNTFCVDESLNSSNTDDEIIEVLLAMKIINTRDQQSHVATQNTLNDGILHNLLNNYDEGYDDQQSPEPNDVLLTSWESRSTILAAPTRKTSNTQKY